MLYTVKNRNLENIKCLVENHFSYNNNIYFEALEKDNMRILEWLIKNVCKKK